MQENVNIFLNKKILIYGFEKTGVSAYKFLKKQNKTYLFDDKGIRSKKKEVKKDILNYKKIKKKKSILS